MTIKELEELMSSGKFHHATYRDIGSLWEGLYVYQHDTGPASFRGFSIAGAFNKNSLDLPVAQALCAQYGTYIGSYS